MMKKIFLLITLLLTACTSPAPFPTLASLSTSTPALPTLTVAPSSTLALTLRPTLTPSPQVTASQTSSPICSVNQMLKALKPLITYAEFDLTYNLISNMRTLNLWFVEPKIDPNASGDQINKNAALAKLSAAGVSAKLAAGDAKCLQALVTTINPIVVDRNYNGWFSGTIKLSDISTNTPPENQVNAFTSVYLRTKQPAPTSPAPTPSCKWLEARTKMQKHFATPRENVGFQFVIDETGLNVYAQWDGELDTSVTSSLLNVATELRCMYPPPDQLVFFVVDGDGKISLIGQTPGTAVRSQSYLSDVPNQVKVLFPQR